MPVIGLVHRAPAVRTALRRGLAAGGERARLVGLRSLEQVKALLRREVVDGLIIDVRLQVSQRLLTLTKLFPGIPIFALSAFRPEDGAILLACREAGVRGIVVEGVDGAGGGEWIAVRTASRLRARAEWRARCKVPARPHERPPETA